VYNLFVVSDGTGGTAERALNAALTQFAGAKVNIIIRPNVRTEKQVQSIVEQTASSGGFIVHTLVSDKLRQVMLQCGRLRNVETIDLMGPLLDRLSRLVATSPAEEPGLFRELNETYFRRIETMEFAFNHDDGLRSEELYKAEIVLLGVSRTFKTPLSIYLAFKGWFVANVPIILDMEIPSQLFEISPSKVFGLRANPHFLAALRRARQEQFNGITGNYAELDYVSREMKYAMKLFSQQNGWFIIDVTSKPIEEIASEILALRRKFNKD
jgi:regulator of PEP synthase PpsR (kinase-PPPase family)